MSVPVAHVFKLYLYSLFSGFFSRSLFVQTDCGHIFSQLRQCNKQIDMKKLTSREEAGAKQIIECNPCRFSNTNQLSTVYSAHSMWSIWQKRMCRGKNSCGSLFPFAVNIVNGAQSAIYLSSASAAIFHRPNHSMVSTIYGNMNASSHSALSNFLLNHSDGWHNAFT